MNANDYLFDKSFEKFIQENLVPSIDTNKNKYFAISKDASGFYFVACQPTLTWVNLFLKPNHILVDTSEYNLSF